MILDLEATLAAEVERLQTEVEQLRTRAQLAEQSNVIVAQFSCPDVGFERIYQDAKWGIQNHAPGFWLAVLMEEVGEVAKAIVENRPVDVRHELVQVAAVAIAAVESLDRNELASQH